MYFKAHDTKSGNNNGYHLLEKLSAEEKEVSTEFFLKCLAHPYQYIRMEAIRRVADFHKKEFTLIFGVSLNDRCDYVVEEAAKALAKINSDEALEILSNAFFEDVIERPHHIANAISEFGERGFAILSKGLKNSSSNIRYYSAKFFGSKDDESSLRILKEVAENDHEKTSFGGLVSTSANRRIKVLTRTKTNRDF